MSTSLRFPGSPFPAPADPLSLWRPLSQGALWGPEGVAPWRKPEGQRKRTRPHAVSLVEGCTPEVPVLEGGHCLCCSLGAGKGLLGVAQTSFPLQTVGMEQCWPMCVEAPPEPPLVLGNSDHAMKKPRQQWDLVRSSEVSTRHHGSGSSP